MKKTFLAMLLLGGTVSVFAQTAPATTPTPTQGNGSTTNPSTTTEPTAQPATNSTMSGTNTTTNANSTMNHAAGNWNGVSASTSWTPETAPSYGWNSYTVWPNSGSLYPNTSAGGFPILNTPTDASVSMNMSGTPVSALPANVQMRFGQDFPAGVSNSYTWNQYGDWFHTYYTKDGRLWQYYYSQRGDGYALALPVIQTYVPENIINSALQKYGSSLYSIGAVKTNSGNIAYQIGLLQKGQLTSQYFDENGATVADVWRVEDSASMSSTQANAAMDNSGSANNANTDANMQSSATTDANMQQSSDANAQQPAEKGKSKLKIKHADGSETKIKMKDGETKIKHNPATNSNDQPQQH